MPLVFATNLTRLAAKTSSQVGRKLRSLVNFYLNLAPDYPHENGSCQTAIRERNSALERDLQRVMPVFPNVRATVELPRSERAFTRASLLVLAVQVPGFSDRAQQS